MIQKFRRVSLTTILGQMNFGVKYNTKRYIYFDISLDDCRISKRESRVQRRGGGMKFKLPNFFEPPASTAKHEPIHLRWSLDFIISTCTLDTALGIL